MFKTVVATMSSVPLLFLSALSACAQDPSEVYTLYRSSVVTPNARIHIATFDADESGDYNQENCWTAADLFQNQPGVRTRFWCEQGTYRE